MTRIPQRQLRNDVSAVLRRAENGERFTITVDGRPVAQLGPLESRRAPASAEELRTLLETAPVDPGWADELRRQRDEDAAAADELWGS